MEGEEGHSIWNTVCVCVCVCVSVSDTCPLLLRALHDADAAVELALGIVVDVGVPAAHVGRGVIGLAAGVVGAAVLEQDVRALLASCPPGVEIGRASCRERV